MHIKDPNKIKIAKAKKNTSFLGGTCNNSSWREKLIPMLKIDYFNPVVDDWTPECMKEEIKQRETCDYVLYVISPLMTGVYSIAEAVDDSNKRPEKTVFCVLENGKGKGSTTSTSFSETELKSLKQVEEMIKENGGKVCKNLEDVAKYLNRSK